MKSQLTHITIGELLQVNTIYRKQLKSLLTAKRRFKLPDSKVEYCCRLELEDCGQPEIEVEIEGCVITEVPIDRGSSVNLMTGTIAFNLGITKF